MTLSRFRLVAIALIGFNIIGTVLTWIAHLQKPGTSLANAIGDGTQFTGPIVLIVIGCAAFGLTFNSRRLAAPIGIALLGLWGLGFAVGEASELFEHNVGVTTDKWNVILAGAVIGLVVGLACAASSLYALRQSRRTPAAVAMLG
jgi:hypothetical protein